VPSLRESLSYEPRELRFGTSGRRGRVVDLTQLEIYINVTGEIEYLQSITQPKGGVSRGDRYYFAHDLRPSSVAFDAVYEGRGELCQAAERALTDAGMIPVNMGAIPTPALMNYALARGAGSLMVTGSHIPFDLNGYKLNRSTGELLKEHENPINEAVSRVRERIYSTDFVASAFDQRGMLREGHRDLSAPDHAARDAYLDRYRKFFAGQSLAGKRVLVYQHSAVARDLLVQILRDLGADVIPAGRSDSFVAIDTEAIDQSQLDVIQALVNEAPSVWAVVSVDGDSDRPLVLGVNNGKVRFYGGDLVGMITAQYLGADSVIVPITCNDAIDRGPLAKVLEPKTKIGSPHVVAGLDKARSKGRKIVCGWEANGGFLLGSDIDRDGRVLTALPTRDAFLPILSVLFAAAQKNVSVTELFAALPKRFSKAALLRNFDRANGGRLVAALSALKPNEVERFFSGFGAIDTTDLTDGVRLLFSSGEVVHFRPSGNADEFRIYAVADSQERADAIAARGIAEPDGIIRQMERALIA
jgi:phosphomannomutase